MDKLIITQEMIEAGLSDNGALSNKQITLLGFGRYSGWRRRAVGKEILTEKYEEFLALKNVHLKKKKKDCLGLNIQKQRDCPFKSCEGADMCSINELEDCDLDNCKLKEYGRIIVDWIE